MSVEPTRVAVLSVSAGAGHVRAAQALERAALETRPDVAVTHVDVMDLVPRVFRKAYADSYLRIVQRYPELWGVLYDRTDRVERQGSRARRARLALERLNTGKLEELLRSHAPRHVLCTHFLPAELLSMWIGEGKLEASLWVQVTDFDVHHLWIRPHVTGYFAASEELAWRMRDRGVPRERVHVTGIPVMPAFGRLPGREACERELGLPPATTRLLMMAGGLGVGGIDRLAERLARIERPLHIVALAGRNARLLADLERLAERHPGRVLAVGHSETVERWMGASDVAVTKPGGLTTSECLAVGLPMIVVSPIPGQEERNADYLLERGVALKAHDGAGLEFRVLELLDDRGRLRAMADAARRMGRPRAAHDVLDVVVGTPA